MYTTNSAEQCELILTDCEAKVVVVENKQQLEKVSLKDAGHKPAAAGGVTNAHAGTTGDAESLRTRRNHEKIRIATPEPRTAAGSAAAARVAARLRGRTPTPQTPPQCGGPARPRRRAPRRRGPRTKRWQQSS